MGCITEIPKFYGCGNHFTISHHFSSSNASGQPNEQRKTLRAFDAIDILHDRRMITLEWIASPVNDMYADAILCAILQAESMETTPSYVPAIGSKEDKMHFKECLIEMLQVILHSKTLSIVASIYLYFRIFSS